MFRVAQEGLFVGCVNYRHLGIGFTQPRSCFFGHLCIVSSFIILNQLSKSLASVLWPRLADEASHPDDVLVVHDVVHTEVVMVSSVALKF